MYAVLRLNPFDPDKLVGAGPQLDRFEEVHRAQPSYVGGIVVDLGGGRCLVLNLWESEEGSEQAFQDPEIQQARQAMLESGTVSGPPEISHYEVVDYRPLSTG